MVRSWPRKILIFLHFYTLRLHFFFDELKDLKIKFKLHIFRTKELLLINAKYLWNTFLKLLPLSGSHYSIFHLKLYSFFPLCSSSLDRVIKSVSYNSKYFIGNNLICHNIKNEIYFLCSKKFPKYSTTVEK